MRQRAEALGRDVSAFGGELLTGGKTPTEAADRLKQWRDAGGTHGAVVTMNNGLDSAQAHLDYLASVREALA